MGSDEELLIDITVGRDRRPVRVTRADFQLWISRIRQDQALVEAIRRVLDGREKWLDLDEGDAGIFPERIFPYQDEIDDKLEGFDPDKRPVIGTLLFHKMLDQFRE